MNLLVTENRICHTEKEHCFLKRSILLEKFSEVYPWAEIIVISELAFNTTTEVQPAFQIWAYLHLYSFW